jgi:hypothetical protein
MNWMNAVEDILQRYSGQGSGTAAAPDDPHQDFQEVTQAAPPNVIANGISQAFRSNQTPPFPEMLANLFTHSNPDQRAGMLNQLLKSVGPGTMASIPGLSGLSSLLTGGAMTPEQASQISPSEVQQMAAHAERQNPSVVEQVSSFYAQHPELMKVAGSLALTVALQHMLKHR